MSVEPEIRMIHEKQIERAWLDDRRWFSQNPSRAYRLRDRIPFEFNTLDPATDAFPGMTVRTIVYRLPAGAHFTQAVGFAAAVPNDDVDDEELASIFGQLVPAEILHMINTARVKLADLECRVRV
jgi:hypothetical protein